MAFGLISSMVTGGIRTHVQNSQKRTLESGIEFVASLNRRTAFNFSANVAQLVLNKWHSFKQCVNVLAGATAATRKHTMVGQIILRG